jgi:hypothetical protein
VAIALLAGCSSEGPLVEPLPPPTPEESAADVTNAWVAAVRRRDTVTVCRLLTSNDQRKLRVDPVPGRDCPERMKRILPRLLPHAHGRPKAVLPKDVEVDEGEAHTEIGFGRRIRLELVRGRWLVDAVKKSTEPL